MLNRLTVGWPVPYSFLIDLLHNVSVRSIQENRINLSDESIPQILFAIVILLHYSACINIFLQACYILNRIITKYAQKGFLH